MSTLAQIGLTAHAVPGLRVWSAPDVLQSGLHDRFSVVASDERGAVELWQLGGGPLGGIEVHSPTPLYGDEDSPIPGCHVLGGRDCYCDGSSLAFTEQAHPLIAAGDSAAVLRLLADWHAREFGGAR